MNMKFVIQLQCGLYEFFRTLFLSIHKISRLASTTFEQTDKPKARCLHFFSDRTNTLTSACSIILQADVNVLVLSENVYRNYEAYDILKYNKCCSSNTD